MIAKSPWYLLPLTWAWTGTTITGFFVIGHDCAHKSFSKKKLVEDIVGTLAFMPLIYPYEPWCFKHDRYHDKTNMYMLDEDTAWHCVMKEKFGESPLFQKAIVYGYGPIRPIMSISHWLIWHFDLNKLRLNEIKSKDQPCLRYCIHGNWIAFNHLQSGDSWLDKVLVKAMVGLSFFGWELSQWFTTPRLTYLSNLPRSGMRQRPNVTAL